MKKSFSLIATAVLLLASCTSAYRLVGVERSRILIDSSYDRQPDAEAAAFLAPYKKSVDSLMSPVVGHTAHYMEAKGPESDLSNLLSDILIWGSKKYGEQPVFSVYNMGGIRAALPEGAVTIGDIFNVAPFENKICFFDMTGDAVMELFTQIAASGGQGVSHGVELVISRDRKLLSAKLNGNDIDRSAVYRVASIDYLAQGNDGLTAFKKKTRLNSPQTAENNVRYIIMDYFREKEKKGETVDCREEGRIIRK
jgi:2',3'-cyclic-nucleotide 2'-phosphodiesterase (5'-nucleotidase family)